MFFLQDNHSLSLRSGDTSFRIFFFLTIILLLCNIVFTLLDVEAYSTYAGYAISDYMINYQAGFVRRGLLGELLLQCFRLVPFPLYKFIVWFDLIIFITFVGFSLRIYRKMMWIPIVPFIFIIGKITLYRRDFLMLFLAYFSFFWLFKFLRTRKIPALALSTIISVISILIYEPSFFFIVPVSIVLYWSSISPIASCAKRLGKTFLVFLLPLVSMILVCFFNGDASASHTIFKSWQPLFDYSNVIPDEDSVLGLSFMVKTTPDVIIDHLNKNFGFEVEKTFFDPLLVVGFFVFAICFYYLSVWISCKKISKIEQDKQLISELYIFQFICLSPMFSVLSCDFGRTILYVVFSTLFIVYLMRENNRFLHIPIVRSLSSFILCKATKFNWLNNSWIYFLVIVITPFQRWFGTPLFHNFIQEYFDMLEPLKSYLGLC